MEPPGDLDVKGWLKVLWHGFWLVLDFARSFMTPERANYDAGHCEIIYQQHSRDTRHPFRACTASWCLLLKASKHDPLPKRQKNLDLQAISSSSNLSSWCCWSAVPPRGSARDLARELQQRPLQSRQTSKNVGIFIVATGSFAITDIELT